MKKVIIIVLFIFLLCGCSKKEEIEEIKEDVFKVEKVDNDKDYIYFDELKTVKYDKDKDYSIKNIIINIKGNEIDNVNLELKNFVLNSYNKMNIKDDILDYGNIISYEYYVLDEYVSIIQNYFFYIKGTDEEINSNVYVIYLSNGKLLSNKEILSKYEYSEERLFKYMEENLDTEDITYTMMQVKNNGYKLYINGDGKMVVIYNEILDNGIIKKELIIN